MTVHDYNHNYRSHRPRTGSMIPPFRLGVGLLHTLPALKADQSPPFWYRDSVQLTELLQGAWDEVSPSFVEKLLAAFKQNDQAAIEKLLKTVSNLGSEMADELGKSTEAVFSNLMMKSEAFWKLHAKDVGLDKPKSFTQAYLDDMAELQANQIKALTEKFPERILHPEVVKQLEYLQTTETPDALMISSIADKVESALGAEEYWKGLSDVQVARAWHADGIQYADKNGIGTGRVTGPMDDLTCPVCRHLVGTEIDIARMMEKIDADLDIEDPDAYAEAWSFPRISDVDGVDRAELGDLLVENGWLAPFHPHCRHSVAWLYLKDNETDKGNEEQQAQSEADQEAA